MNGYYYRANANRQSMWWFSFLFLCLFSPGITTSQQQQQASATEDVVGGSSVDDTFGGGVDLYSLSNTELEEICTLRGFELVQHEEQVFSHDDYVEAARQCLAIERDMEEIIAEHPEILEELQEEQNRILAEKERLESELASQHTAMLPNKNMTEELVDLDRNNNGGEDISFDVIGHQEPLSDSRVHHADENETPRDNESEPASAESTDDTLLSTRGEEEEEEAGSIHHFEALMEVRDRIMRDLTVVANIIFPKVIRPQVKAALRTAGKVLKQVGMDLYQFIQRHVMVMIDARKQQRVATNDVVQEQDTPTQQQQQHQHQQSIPDNESIMQTDDLPSSKDPHHPGGTYSPYEE